MVSPQFCSDNRILTKIMYFAYMTTLKVRQVLRKNNAGYISFFTLSEPEQEKKVCRLAAKVHEWIRDRPQDNPYFGLSLQGVGYKTVDEKEVVYWTQRKHTDKSIYKDIVTFLTDSADERKLENSQTKVDFVTCGLHEQKSSQFQPTDIAFVDAKNSFASLCIKDKDLLQQTVQQRNEIALYCTLNQSLNIKQPDMADLHFSLTRIQYAFVFYFKNSRLGLSQPKEFMAFAKKTPTFVHR